MSKETGKLSWTAKMHEDSFDIVSLEVCQDGEMMQKNLTVQDFVKALSEATDKEQLFRIGKLPRGYYDGGIYPLISDSFQCVVVVPAGRRLVQYYDTTYDVPYPAAVFTFSVRQRRLNNSRVFFVDTDTPDDDSALYQYCFANVASETGKICWGANQLPELSCMQDCDKLVALFFGSPCNDDYYSYSRFATGAPEYCKTQRALYEKLCECETFPLEVLASTGKTVKEIL